MIIKSEIMKNRSILFMLFLFYNCLLFAQTQLGNTIIGEGIGDESGWSVSLSSDGNRIAIGAPFNNGGDNNTGHVRVYQKDGNEWQQLGGDFNGSYKYDRMGNSVSLSGDGNRVAIGAPFYDSLSTDEGMVEVFEFTGSEWVQLGNSIVGDTIVGEFGTSVALSTNGNRIVIGAPSDSKVASSVGKAQVYDFNGTEWVQLGEDLIPEFLGYGEFYGYSVSISADGNRIAIGIPFRAAFPNGAREGQIRVYDYDGDNWQQTGGNINGQTPNGFLGRSIALSPDGNRLVAGAPSYYAPNPQQIGYVSVFEYNGTNWTPLGQPLFGTAKSHFGYSVAIAYDTIVVGAPRHNGTSSKSGIAQLFAYDGSNWNQIGETLHGEAGNDFFGSSVAMAPNSCRFAVGAIGHDGNGNNSGQVKVYSCSLLPPVAEFACQSDSVSMLLYQFSDESFQDPTDWDWDFGDGETSTEMNPEHLYSSDGIYEICLTVSNTVGEDSICKTVSVIASGLTEIDEDGLSVFPNPVKDVLYCHHLEISYWDQLELLDATGRVVRTQENSNTFSVAGISSGIYFIQLKKEDKVWRRKVIVE